MRTVKTLSDGDFKKKYAVQSVGILLSRDNGCICSIVIFLCREKKENYKMFIVM